MQTGPVATLSSFGWSNWPATYERFGLAPLLNRCTIGVQSVRGRAWLAATGQI